MKSAETFDAITSPIAKYIRDRRAPVPFSDFYDTIEGVYDHFIGRSVQGGMFMPILMKKWKTAHFTIEDKKTFT